MSTNQNSHSATHKEIFLDFEPAEIGGLNGNDWRIYFRVKVPGEQKMKLFRRRVKKYSNKTVRMRYAKRMCSEINKKLEKGWSPLFDGYADNEFFKLVDVLEKFLGQAERKLNDNLLRKDTYRSYTSYAKNIEGYLKERGKEDLFTIQFDRTFIIEFLDHIYYDKKRTARTSNNYLSFYSQLCVFMVDRKYLPSNPTLKISKRKVGKKKREILPTYLRNDIFKYQSRISKEYLTLCLLVYFCFIRRTELTKLQVKNIDLKKSTVFIPAEISKNNKDGIVTIPKKLKILLAKHIDTSFVDDFLFSNENFKTGKNKLEPKKVSDEWAKMRNALNFESKYQFYSLKDTGITELFYLDVPLIKIRDQARHHDIKITETYAPRNYKADEFLRDLDFNF
ncbi:site-specific integrase [Mesonia sp. K4-1]|uniref:tyrosine-type recombinase/integrase n=1 Tax=Mesonia sp. K4-1 TaxID=2602760 RepID=UPI0011C9D183|nr:site-specific integrase [Mesonia sp. K4-1]TXK71972.1 site-specific integrase [Mesonia sp. K4-1]